MQSVDVMMERAHSITCIFSLTFGLSCAWVYCAVGTDLSICKHKDADT